MLIEDLDDLARKLRSMDVGDSWSFGWPIAGGMFEIRRVPMPKREDKRKYACCRCCCCSNVGG